MAAWAAVVRSVSTNSAWSWPAVVEPLVEGEALGLEAHGEVLQALLHLAVDERLGHLDVDELGQRVADLLAERHLGLHLAHRGHAVGQVVAQLGEGLELGGLGRPLVVGLGQHALLDLLDGDHEVQALLVGVGVLGVELELVAGRRTHERLVELGHDAGAADLVGVVLGGQALERLVALRALDVDGDVVALGRRTLDGGELGVLAEHALDLVVDLLVGGHGRRDGDAQALVARHDHDGADLDDGFEGDRAVLLALGDVDLGGGDDVDVVVLHGLGVVLGDGVAEGLAAGHALAEPLLEDAPGGLARPEPGDVHLTGDLAEGRVDRLFEFGLVDLDRELDLVVFEFLDGRLHGR